MSVGVPRSCRLLLLLAVFVLPSQVAAQSTARVRVAEENFRRDPGGSPLATVFRGAELPVLTEQGNWVQVALQGWIWGPSVSQTDRGGFDLRVQVEGGENLRAVPQGQIQARLLLGCLLERVGSSGDWYQVRRRGWVWKPSLEISAASGSGGGPAVTPPRTQTSPANEPALITAPNALAVHANPDGDTIATVEPGGQAQILGRSGDWVRVRVDGWVYGPAVLDSALNLADTGDLTPAQLRADPGRYKGALVRWRVQIISLQYAERARADFEEGEPFLLARGAAGDAGFVYLAVPEALLELAKGLEPLELVTVVGRVRTGRSFQVGSPVIDLTDIEAAEGSD